MSFKGMAGVVLSGSLNLSYICSNGIIGFSQFELEFASYEILKKYCSLTPESSWDRPRSSIKLEEQKILNNKNIVLTEPSVKVEPWMKKAGELRIKNLQFRYRPELPIVLKNITFTVKPAERVGIVGRTGNGKSSTINALFRINEPEPGSEIEFNGVNMIEDICLYQLRKTFSIVPQEPWLIEGTLRQNIDPVALAKCENVSFYKNSSQMTDKELWNILELCNMKPFVESQPGGLDMYISENGSNLSSGIKQMLCVAKAIQRNSPIVILDEATASLDKNSDKAVQDAIDTALNGKTTISIAHRLDTIIKYDKVCVINEGSVAEYASPADLIKDSTSIFYSLCKRTGDKSFKRLYKMACDAEYHHSTHKKVDNINDNNDIEPNKISF